MLYRISVLEESGVPIFYRRPFSGLTEIEPGLLATLSSLVKSQTNIVMENEIYTVRNVNGRYTVVSHDGDDLGVEQVVEGVKEFAEHSTGQVNVHELLDSIRRNLKPSTREIRGAVNEFESSKPRIKVERITPTHQASEDEMRRLFLSGKLDEVIKIKPSTPLMAAMYIRAATFLESAPEKYPRASVEYVESLYQIVSDRRVAEYLKLTFNHAIDPIMAGRKFVNVYRENRGYFFSLIRSDPVWGPILFYPVGDIELYKLIMERFGETYWGILAKTLYDFRMIPKNRDVKSMLSLRPHGEGLLRLSTLATVAFSRDLMRYIADEDDLDDILAEAPLVSRRFSSLLDILSSAPLVPVTIYAQAINRFGVHIYRMSGAALMKGRKLAMSGMRKAIDKAMKLVSDRAVHGVINPYILGRISASLLEAMYGLTKLRGEKFEPSKVKHLRTLAGALACKLDSKRLAKLEKEAKARSPFITLLNITVAVSKLYAGLGKDDSVINDLRKALERSLLSKHIEDLPLFVLDVLDSLGSLYARSAPSAYTVREIIGYVKRLAVFPLVLQVLLRRMKTRFEDFGYKDLVQVVVNEMSEM